MLDSLMQLGLGYMVEGMPKQPVKSSQGHDQLLG